MELIAASYKYKLCPFVLKRFETNIDGGVVCLYNAKDDIFWVGNSSVFLILNLLDGNNTLSDIKNYFADFFDMKNNFDEVSFSINNIFKELMKNRMIEKV